MILGPTGSGKEALAKFIFFNSPRRGGDFVAVNCSAIPEALFESEMFGIEKGVATGVDRRPGLIEVADKGTLFLDEVGDMSLACQVKLLRVLEERRVRRVGARTSKEVDLHIISATNADLAAKVKAKLFREDLWYRLNVVELKLPALNTRGSDILLLAKHFLKIQAIRLNRPELTISDEVKDILMAYDWPGNIRELANEMERVTALAAGTEIKPQDLSEKLKALAASSSFASSPSTQSPNSSPLRPHKGDSSSTPPAPPDKLLKSISDRAVIETLALHDGNKTRAAKDLGLSREGLRKRLARIGPGLARGLK
jgi:DNA-binding NtrC family response regulator